MTISATSPRAEAPASNTSKARPCPDSKHSREEEDNYERPRPAAGRQLEDEPRPPRSDLQRPETCLGTGGRETRRQRVRSRRDPAIHRYPLRADPRPRRQAVAEIRRAGCLAARARRTYGGDRSQLPVATDRKSVV